MAIDDNTLYGLTGAQVKELPEKIEAVKGKAKVLTTADYNWPVDNPTSVALWLLEPGYYVGPSDSNVNVKPTSSHNDRMGDSYPHSALVIHKAIDNNNRGALVWFSDTPNATSLYSSIDANGSNWSERKFDISVANSLTSTSTTTALSANQGKVLKDFIGDLTNLTTTDKTNLVAAINEAAASGGGGPTVVQTTGTSTTDVMSQNATTSMVYADPSTRAGIRLGAQAVISSDRCIAIGYGAAHSNINDPAPTGASPNATVAIGSESAANNAWSTAIGPRAFAYYTGSVALGAGSKPTHDGEVNIGSQYTSYGYNNSNYRLLTGLYDPQSDHDAANKGYVDNSLLGKQDTLTAGSGISIADESGNLVISTTVAEPDEFTSNEWNALWS